MGFSSNSSSEELSYSSEEGVLKISWLKVRPGRYEAYYFDTKDVNPLRYKEETGRISLMRMSPNKWEAKFYPDGSRTPIIVGKWDSLLLSRRNLEIIFNMSRR